MTSSLTCYFRAKGLCHWLAGSGSQLHGFMRLCLGPLVWHTPRKYDIYKTPKEDRFPKSFTENAMLALSQAWCISLKTLQCYRYQTWSSCFNTIKHQHHLIIKVPIIQFLRSLTGKRLRQCNSSAKALKPRAASEGFEMESLVEGYVYIIFMGYMYSIYPTGFQ